MTVNETDIRESECADLQALSEYGPAIEVPPEDFDDVATAAAEEEKVPCIWVLLNHDLHELEQAIERATHVHRFSRDKDSNGRGEIEHYRFSNDATTDDRKLGEQADVLRTTMPQGRTTSIFASFKSADISERASVMLAGTKPIAEDFGCAVSLTPRSNRLVLDFVRATFRWSAASSSSRARIIRCQS
jgi:hypothetical protein